MTQLSSSSLSIFESCPKCFYNDRNLKLKRPEGIKSGLPIAIDKIIKEQFDAYRGKLPPSLQGDDRLNGFVLYDAPELKKMQHWKSNPLKMTDENGNTIVGAFDDLLYNPTTDQFAFLDFKSSGKERDEAFGKQYYQKQIDIYTQFFIEAGRKVADFAVLLFFWPEPSENGFIQFKSKPVFLKPEPSAAVELFRRAMLCLDAKIVPPSGEDCEYCKFAFERSEKK